MEHGKKFAAVRRGMQMIPLHYHFVPVHPARCLAFERLLLLATMPQPEQVEVSPASGRLCPSFSYPGPQRMALVRAAAVGEIGGAGEHNGGNSKDVSTSADTPVPPRGRVSHALVPARHHEEARGLPRAGPAADALAGPRVGALVRRMFGWCCSPLRL